MKAAFFDIDGTLVSGFSGVSFLSFLSDKGIFANENKKRLLEVTERYKNKKATYEEFAKTWGKETRDGLKDQKQEEVIGLTEEFWPIIQPRFAHWAKDVISLFNNNGYLTIAISGSPIELLNLYKERLGLIHVFASTLEVNNGTYTGNLLLNLILSKEKSTVFNTFVSENHIDLQDSFGFGDNEHDRSFLDRVGHPIVIASESSLKEYARSKGWPVYNMKDNVADKIRGMSL